jgi:hypothetical protein
MTHNNPDSKKSESNNDKGDKNDGIQISSVEEYAILQHEPPTGSVIEYQFGFICSWCQKELKIKDKMHSKTKSIIVKCPDCKNTSEFV